MVKADAPGYNPVYWYDAPCGKGVVGDTSALESFGVAQYCVLYAAGLYASNFADDWRSSMYDAHGFCNFS